MTSYAVFCCSSFGAGVWKEKRYQLGTLVIVILASMDRDESMTAVWLL